MHLNSTGWNELEISVHSNKITPVYKDTFPNFSTLSMFFALFYANSFVIQLTVD